MPGCANAFANRGRIVKMDNRDSDDLILDPRFFNGLLAAVTAVAASKTNLLRLWPTGIETPQRPPRIALSVIALSYTLLPPTHLATGLW
jgi:hypothetical protein